MGPSARFAYFRRSAQQWRTETRLRGPAIWAPCMQVGGFVFPASRDRCKDSLSSARVGESKAVLVTVDRSFRRTLGVYLLIDSNALRILCGAAASASPVPLPISNCHRIGTIRSPR